MIALASTDRIQQDALVPSVEVVGIYEVEADEPGCLVELIVHDGEGPFDIGAITQ